ncbi:capsule assembly Wzi family protein [Rhabdobacter roseus]
MGLLLGLGYFSAARAQYSAWQPSVEVGGYAATTARTPFWLRANQWGRVPLLAPVATARLGLSYDSRRVPPDTSLTTRPTFRSRLSWGAGAEGVYNLGRSSEVLLPEAYARVQWGPFEVWGGRRREIIGLVDTTLSTGATSWSGNAQAVPKIQVGIPDFVPLKFLKNYLSIRGFYAHGWFNTPYIKGAYLHQKALYGRFGLPNGKVRGYLGLDHHVMWAGQADYLKGSILAVDGKLTSDFRDYLWGVVIGKIPKQHRNERFNNFDGENRVGNHVGHYSLAVDYRWGTSTLLLYHNHYFEDASGMMLQNIPDGLYGLSWQRRPTQYAFFKLRKILLEWLYTRDQTTPTFDVPGSRFKGNDNYFNHAQYREGWSYLGRALGTPFIAPKYELVPELGENSEFFPNNLIEVYHLGLEGTLLDRVQLRAKASYSLNRGTNNIPFQTTVRQFSSLLAFELPVFRWGHTRLTGQLAYDQGGLLPRTFGGYLGVRSTGWAASDRRFP